MHRSLRNFAISPTMAAMASALGAMHRHTEGAEAEYALPGGYRNANHGWAGKRRKLKKSHQDHQRPRRRRI